MRGFLRMIFDIHRHLSPNFAADMRENDLRGACIHPSLIAGDFIHYDAYLAQAKVLRQHTSIPILIFGIVDFKHSPEHLAADITLHHLAGVKMHPKQEYPLLKHQLAPYMAVIEQAKIPLYIHTDWEPGRQFGHTQGRFKETFVQVAMWFPRVPIIMGHAGNNDSYLEAKRCLKSLSNVYVETSLAPVPSEITKMVKIIGSRRVLFGSNAPHASYAVERKKIEVLVLPATDKEDILYHSGKTLMGGGMR